MPSKSKAHHILLLTALAIFMVFSACRKQEKIIQVNPAFSPYVTAFTSGIISKASQIKIQFAQPFNDTEASMEGILSFKPGLKGKVFWEDKRTLVFIPETQMPSGVRYTAEINLKKLIHNIPEELAVMAFQFQTMSQHFESQVESFQPYDPVNLEWYVLRGSVRTADMATHDEVAGILHIENMNDLPIKWEHQEGGRLHHFQIDSIQRGLSEIMIKLHWDGKALGTSYHSIDELRVPAIGDFSVISSRLIQDPEQSVVVIFSDPLDDKQDLNGLVRLEEGLRPCHIKYSVDRNELKIYPAQRQFSTLKLIIDTDIRNVMGYPMQHAFEMDVEFQEIRPSIRFSGQGVILPTSGQMSMPFETVNLKAIDVKVIRIFENNIAQFFQLNRLDGESQLRRVGRLVHSDRIDLFTNQDINLKQWNTFSLDLSKLIKAEPGAIYRIFLSFRKEYSLYRCSGDLQEGSMRLTPFSGENQDDWRDESSGYYYYDDYGYDEYSYYDDEDYDWRQRENPCNSSYFQNKTISRNLLSSDLGLIAKLGSDRSLWVVVTDLRSAEPLTGIEIDILDYQNQLLGRTRTDNQGFATIKPHRKPFLLVAKHKDQRGYLRLDDGNSLSVSMFDISGEVVQRGLKGYIYGERGVYRPGDTLFLTFLLEDKEKRLPLRHPVNFELLNPNSQLVHSEVQTEGLDGFYSFQIRTLANAPTGSWTARVKVGGNTYSRSVRIETIKPNRLKLDLSFGADPAAILQGPIEGKLNAKWLHGVSARNLKAKVNITLKPTRTTFKGYEKYCFDDPVRKIEAEEIMLFDGALDQTGAAAIKADIPARSTAPGMLAANFSCRVFEESGDFSTDNFTRLYAPFPSFVGLKLPDGEGFRGTLFTDKPQRIDIISLTKDGKLKKLLPLEIQVYKLDWRWWWDATRDNLASWTGKVHGNLVRTISVTTDQNGKADFKLTISENEWGRYLIRVMDEEGGHFAGKVVYFDWPGWAARGSRDIPGGATMLTFSADKNSYQVGESVKVSFPSPEGGRALVSIENGTKVIESYWVSAQSPETIFSFKVTEEMAPNAYIHITLIQKHSQTLNDAPIRLYGILPLFVEDPESKLSPRISMPDVLAPGQAVRIKITEAKGKAMTYTVAVVDEGLLDLTRFTTPNPWSVFYAREALGVKTWDLFDLVIGARGGRIESLFSIGGDEGLQVGASRKADRFKPVVKFFGPFHLKAGSGNTHSFAMPDYVGSVRTMVISGYQGAYGSAEKTTPVRKPLMVLTTLPRVVGPGETLKLPVTVFAMEPGIKTVEVNINTNKLLQVRGLSKKTIQFTEVGEQVVEFDLSVSDRIGIGEVKVNVVSGKENAISNTELDVRVPNPELYVIYESTVDAGKSWEVDYNATGIAGTNHALLEVSSMLPVNLGDRLQYLITYPHGCVEQITSTVFPQLFLNDIAELDLDMQNRIPENIKAGISKLTGFLLPSGGFSYWPNAAESNDWGTTYAGHFLLEAASKGYAMPVGFKNNWIRFQKTAANQWSPNTDPARRHQGSDLMQAYRLYTLALAGAPELGAMNRLKGSSNLSPQASWRLAAAYALAGQIEIARKMAENLTTQIPTYTEMSNTFGTAERDLAMILEAMILLGEKDKALGTAKRVAAQLNGQDWMSTQTTAYSLLAISKYMGNQAKQTEIHYALSINSGKSIEVTTSKPLRNTDIPIKGAEGGKIKIMNTGKGTLYARLVVSGKPKAGLEKAHQQHLRMEATYLTMDGKPIDISQLKQGTDFIAQITLFNPGTLGRLKELSLEQIVASGWEIRNLRMDPGLAAHMLDLPKYQDIRDDRAYSYFDLESNQRKVFRLVLNASYTGRYYLPAIRCTAMYDNQVNALIPGQWVEIVKAEN